MNVRRVTVFVALGLLGGVWVLAWLGSKLVEGAAGFAPIEPRAFESLTLVTAGTGGAWENPQRLGPVLAVGLGQRIALVDAGRGISEALRAAEIPLVQPTAVYLTSLAPENTVGLDDLLLTGWLAGRSQPLRVVGPPGTGALVAGIQAAHKGADARAAELALPEAGGRLAAEEVHSDVVGTRDGLTIRALALSDGPSERLAWRFEADGRALVIAPFPGNEEALAEFSNGAALLVREAAYVPSPEEARAAGIETEPDRLRREARLHTPFDSVARLAQEAGVDTLVLVRLRPPPVYDFQVTGMIGDAFDGRIVIAEDGEQVTPEPRPLSTRAAGASASGDGTPDRAGGRAQAALP